MRRFLQNLQCAFTRFPGDCLRSIEVSHISVATFADGGQRGCRKLSCRCRRSEAVSVTVRYQRVAHDRDGALQPWLSSINETSEMLHVFRQVQSMQSKQSGAREDRLTFPNWLRIIVADLVAQVGDACSSSRRSTKMPCVDEQSSCKRRKQAPCRATKVLLQKEHGLWMSD